MEYKKRIVCFLDILGFQNHINDTIKSDGADNASKIESIRKALYSMAYLNDVAEINGPNGGINATQFSDSIVLSFDYKHEDQLFFRLNFLHLVIFDMVNRGFLCRGGIAAGKIFHSKEMVFGPAMNEAYRLESEVAVYPRVIFADNLFSIACERYQSNSKAGEEMRAINKMVKKDEDDLYYIDYFNSVADQCGSSEFTEYQNNLHKTINTGLTSKNSKIKAKYQWMKTKYDQAFTAQST